LSLLQAAVRYQTTEFDKQHGHLRHVMFVCTCNLASDRIVANSSSPVQPG
jgi:hypothetical protein